jgi:hypothetical protein
MFRISTLLVCFGETGLVWVGTMLIAGGLTGYSWALKGLKSDWING